MNIIAWLKAAVDVVQEHRIDRETKQLEEAKKLQSSLNALADSKAAALSAETRLVAAKLATIKAKNTAGVSRDERKRPSGRNNKTS